MCFLNFFLSFKGGKKIIISLNVCVLLLLVQMLNSEISSRKKRVLLCRQAIKEKKKMKRRPASLSARLPDCQIAVLKLPRVLAALLNVVRFALRLRDCVFCQNFLRLCTLFFRAPLIQLAKSVHTHKCNHA